VIHLTILSDEFEEMGSATIDGHDVTIDLFGDDLEDGLAEVAAYFNESKIDLMIDPEVWEDPSTPEYFTEDQIEIRVNWWFWSSTVFRNHLHRSITDFMQDSNPEIDALVGSMESCRCRRRSAADATASPLTRWLCSVGG